MEELLQSIRHCSICSAYLPLGPNPILSAHKESKIILVSQAPGRIAHQKNVAWDDPGGRKLREWMGVSTETFYNPQNFAILPMGFCYPGKASTGDLPPRPECMPQWHSTVLKQFTSIKLTVLIGQYAQRAYLGERFLGTLTQTVKSYHNFLPQFLPIPHPSPVNRFWISKNPWFVQDTVPQLQQIIKEILDS